MIAITGASGLIGAHILVELLKKGEKVRAILRPGSSIIYTTKILKHYGVHQRNNHIEWVSVSSLEDMLEAIDEVDCLIHAAGYISFDNRFEKKLMHSNKHLTRDWVNACLLKKVPSFIYISSIAAIGEENILSANQYKWGSIGWSHAYGFSKFMGELETWRGKEEGLNVAILRPGVVLGPVHQKHILYKSIKWMKNNPLFVLPGKLALIDARQVATMTWKMIENQSFNNYPVVAVSQQKTIRNFSEYGAQALGNMPKIIKIPHWLILLVAPLTNFVAYIQGKDRPLTKNIRLSMKHEWVFDQEVEPIYSATESLKNCFSFISNGNE